MTRGALTEFPQSLFSEDRAGTSRNDPDLNSSAQSLSENALHDRPEEPDLDPVATWVGSGAVMLEESSPATVPATAVHCHTRKALREGAMYPSVAGLDPERMPRQRSCLGTAESLAARPLGRVAIPSRRDA